MAPSRKGETICDSLFMTIGVFVPVVVSLYLYRHEPKSLFRILFIVFLLFVGFVMTRHIWARLANKVVGYFNKNEESEVSPQRPDLDRSRKEAVSKAQGTHDEKAEDFEYRVAGPRRERKLKELETKMRAVRGLKDEGMSLGGASASSRLLESDDMEESHDTEGGGSGWVTIAIKLPDRSARRKFRVTQRVRSLYNWLDSLGYPSADFMLTTLFPKSLLDDKEKTLEQVDLTNDTTLAVEEKDD